MPCGLPWPSQGVHESLDNLGVPCNRGGKSVGLPSTFYSCHDDTATGEGVQKHDKKRSLLAIGRPEENDYMRWSRHEKPEKSPPLSHQAAICDRWHPKNRG